MTLKFVPVLNRQWGFFKMKCVNDRKYNLFRQRHEYLKATALEGKKQTKITADKFMKQTVHEVEHVLRYVEATHFAQDFMEHIEHTVPRHVLHKSVAFFTEIRGSACFTFFSVGSSGSAGFLYVAAAFPDSLPSVVLVRSSTSCTNIRRLILDWQISD